MADDFKFSGDGPSYDWFYRFGASALESMPELIGITPSTETVQWRQDNPVSGFVSEFAGMAVPYFGWFRATQAVPRVARALGAIGNPETKPVLTAAMREATRFAPFEVGRTAVSQVVGDKSLAEMSGEAAFNLAAGAGVAGLLGGVLSGGVRSEAIRNLFPNLNLTLPYPLQARFMRKVVEEGGLEGERLNRAAGKLNEAKLYARLEEPGKNYRYLGPLAGDDAGAIRQELERLFKVSELPHTRVVQTRRFTATESKDFRTVQDWQKAATEAGLPPNFEEFGQYFRHVSFHPKKGSGASAGIDKRLAKNMEQVERGVFLGQEADDGMFIIAKKYTGEVGKGSVDDKWVVFKTDQPGRFLPDNDAWAKAVIARNKWNPIAADVRDGGEVFNVTQGYMRQFPLAAFRELKRRGGGGIVDKLLPQNIRGQQQEVVARMGEIFKEYLAPRMFQFKKSERATWIMNGVKDTFEHAESLVQELMFGRIKLDSAKNLWRQTLGNITREQGRFPTIRDSVMAVPEEQFQSQFWRAWKGELSADAMKAAPPGTYSPEVISMAEKLEAVDRFVRENINKAQKASGASVTKWREGHYGVSRKWEGDSRVVIRDAEDNVVALASGMNRAAAHKQAQELIRNNPGWAIREEFSMSSTGIPQKLETKAGAPSFTLEREGMRGYKFDTKPFSREEFIKEAEENLRKRMLEQARLSVDDLFTPELNKLQREDPAAWRMLTARINDYEGVQSAFGKWQNKLVDQVLGPMLGPNSATKIVGNTSTLLFNFQLGAMRLSYPTINALEFLQNVVPETAFIIGRALPEHLAANYTHFAIGGTKGPTQGVAVLQPLRLMGQSFKEMSKPSDELKTLFARGVSERVIDPRLVENYIGSAAATVGDLKGALSSGGGFASWLRALSEYLPAQTEKFSRAQAFTTGYIMARDYLQMHGQKLTQDQMYQFARQFTERTKYLYSVADKSRIFTSPAGSLMGVFKNWLFHFMGQMGEYTAEGFMRNNWAPLLWQTGGTFALGGLASTPLYMAAETFSRMWSDKSILEMSHEELGAWPASGLMWGLPAIMANLSMYSTIQTPAANPMREASQLFSVAAWDRVQSLRKLGGAAMDQWQSTGEHPGHNRQVRELLIRTFAPTSVYRAWGAFEQPDQLTQLGTGRPLIKNAGLMDRLLYAGGFNPVDLERGQFIATEIYNSREKLREQTTKLGRAWAEAQYSGNSEAMANIMRQAMVWGVDVSSVIRSGTNQYQQMQQDVAERVVRPRDFVRILNAMNAMRGE